MNYIKKLQTENETLKARIAAFESGLDSIKQYVTSSKFSCGDAKDGYVAVEDIILRVEEVRSAAFRI